MAKNNAPRILMCRPKHFGVTYAINPWMDPKSWASEAKSLAAAARREWRALHARLKELGAEIELVPPEPGLPDLVFTANSAVVMDGKALLARFRHPERQGEEPVFERAFEKLQATGRDRGNSHAARRRLHGRRGRLRVRCARGSSSGWGTDRARA